MDIEWRADLILKQLIEMKKEDFYLMKEDDGVRIMNVCKRIIPDIYKHYEEHQYQDAILDTLTHTEQYRKLSEFILMRNERGNTWFF